MKNTLPSKIVLQKWRNKDFPEKQKLREFITTRPAFQEMPWKGVPQAKMKEC